MHNTIQYGVSVCTEDIEADVLVFGKAHLTISTLRSTISFRRASIKGQS